MLLEETLERIRPLDRSFEVEAQKRLDSLTKPQGSLGKLEELARRVAVIQRKVPPHLGRKLLFVFAADHGITEEGVSAYPKEVTAQMTYNFLRGGAAINVLARHYGVEVEVIDIGVDYEFANPAGLRNCKVRRGTDNFSRGTAMTRSEASAIDRNGNSSRRRSSLGESLSPRRRRDGDRQHQQRRSHTLRLDGRCAPRCCRERHGNRRSDLETEKLRPSSAVLK